MSHLKEVHQQFSNLPLKQCRVRSPQRKETSLPWLLAHTQVHISHIRRDLLDRLVVDAGTTSKLSAGLNRNDLDSPALQPFSHSLGQERGGMTKSQSEGPGK